MEPLRNKRGQTLEEFLADYDETRYRRPSVTVDMLVLTPISGRLCVLLIRRGDHPFLGTWALPGGFVNMDEDLHEAAARELWEETSLEGIPLLQFGAFGAVNRDPRTRVITVGHFALAPAGSILPKAGDDAADAQLFALDILPDSRQPGLRHMRLTGPEELTLWAKLEDNGFCPAVAQAGGDLASDHPLVLFSGLCAIARLDRQRVVSALAGQDAGLCRELSRQIEGWGLTRV